MPLILGKGQEIKILSKNEVKKKIEDAQTNLSDEEKELQKLSPELAEKRREILAAKKHREYMEKIDLLEQQARERILKEKQLEDAEIQTVEEIVVETGPDPIIVKHDDVVKVSEAVSTDIETPNFDKMTKKELDEWAEATLGLSLDRRKKKADLIEIIKNNL